MAYIKRSQLNFANGINTTGFIKTPLWESI